MVPVALATCQYSASRPATASLITSGDLPLRRPLGRGSAFAPRGLTAAGFLGTAVPIDLTLRARPRFEGKLRRESFGKTAIKCCVARDNKDCVFDRCFCFRLVEGVAFRG